MFFFLQKIYKISFNSRPHAEVDGPVGLKRTYITSFNSRPHAEVDVFRGLNFTTEKPFNSRPHAEVDMRRFLDTEEPQIFQLTTSRRGRLFLFFRLQFPVYLSTHDLTQRSTMVMDAGREWHILSTHDLTQRSTQ